MPEQGQVILDEEPIGIVIARGRHEEVAPRFSAYIWGTTDDAEDDAALAALSAAVA